MRLAQRALPRLGRNSQAIFPLPRETTSSGQRWPHTLRRPRPSRAPWQASREPPPTSPAGAVEVHGIAVECATLVASVPDAPAPTTRLQAQRAELRVMGTRPVRAEGEGLGEVLFRCAQCRKSYLRTWKWAWFEVVTYTCLSVDKTTTMFQLKTSDRSHPAPCN